MSHRFSSDSHGGTEVLTRDVAYSLKDQGWDVIWMAVSSDGALRSVGRRWEAAGIEEWVLPASFSEDYPLGWESDEHYQARAVADCLDRFLEGRCIDVVHLFHFARLGLAFLNLPALRGLPVYATLTDFTAVCPDFQLFNRRNLQLCAGRVDTQTCVGCIRQIDGQGDAKDAAEINTWRARNLDVFRNRVEGIYVQTPHQQCVLESLGFQGIRFFDNRAAYHVPAFWPFLSRDPVRPPAFNFGFIGRASIEKGIDIVIAAFLSLTGRRPDLDLRLTIVTDDFKSTEAYLRAGAENSRIELRAPVLHSELGSVLIDMDCLLIPSIWLENHPTVLTYALTCGVPVICSNLASLCHLEGISGLGFARAGDHADWDRKMETQAELATPDVSIPAGLPEFQALIAKMQINYCEGIK